jgi:hypothetical protein
MTGTRGNCIGEVRCKPWAKGFLDDEIGSPEGAMTSSYIDDEIAGADFNLSQDVLTSHVRKYPGSGRYFASSRQSALGAGTAAPGVLPFDTP